MRIRTFIAVDVADAVGKRAATFVSRLQESGANVRWVDLDNLHVTLKFLGEVEETEIHEVCQGVQSAVKDFSAFQMHCGRAGAFPNVDRPRTVWLDVQEGQEPLIELHAAIEREMVAIGQPREIRRYRPHLTLGRVRGGGPSLSRLGALLRQFADFNAGETLVEGVVVYASQLDKKGPFYQALSRVPLNAAL